MKFLLMLVGLGLSFACGMEEEEAQHKFTIKKKALGSVVHYYAKYRFALAGYEDVDIAIKVAVQSGQAKTLWARDLGATTNPLEEATLTTSGTNNIRFSGTSGGDFGGTYTGRLETDAQERVTGCCDEMAFVPTAASTLLFVGSKLEDLTAEQWAQLGSGPTRPAPTAMVLELGAKRVGELFSVIGAEGVRRLEAHNSAGKVEGALARWQTRVGADIFAVGGTDELFLTSTAITAGVTELVGFDKDDNKVLQANITVAPRDDTIVLTASRFALGGYTWLAFSANPNPDPENDGRMHDMEKNAYLSLDDDLEIHDHSTGDRFSYAGYDARGVWVAITTFECLVDSKVMARVLDTVYTGLCLAEGGSR